jgi:DNA-binding FrmR family transcriptional regulator
MEPDQRIVEEALVRLAKVEGQVAGVARMLREGRDCREVIAQLSAAGRALDRVGFRLVASGLRRCVTEGGDDAEAAAEELERLFLQIG